MQIHLEKDIDTHIHLHFFFLFFFLSTKTRKEENVTHHVQHQSRKKKVSYLWAFLQSFFEKQSSNFTELSKCIRFPFFLYRIGINRTCIKIKCSPLSRHIQIFFSIFLYLLSFEKNQPLCFRLRIRTNT